MNCVLDLLFDTAELAAMSALDGHARLAIRRNAAHEQAALAGPRFAAVGLTTVGLPMMFTPAIGLAEIEKLRRALEAGLLDG
jgi:hypothetical protein